MSWKYNVCESSFRLCLNGDYLFQLGHHQRVEEVVNISTCIFFFGGGGWLSAALLCKQLCGSIIRSPGPDSRMIYGRSYLTVNLETQYLPNSKNLWISCNVNYYIDTLWSYWNNLLMNNFLELGKSCVSQVHQRSTVNRSRIRFLVYLNEMPVSNNLYRRVMQSYDILMNYALFLFIFWQYLLYSSKYTLI